MNETIKNEKLIINVDEIKHLKIEVGHNEYIATLVDPSGYQIVKGYGDTTIDAINDLHSNCL